MVELDETPGPLPSDWLCAGSSHWESESVDGNMCWGCVPQCLDCNSAFRRNEINLKTGNEIIKITSSFVGFLFLFEEPQD